MDYKRYQRKLATKERELMEMLNRTAVSVRESRQEGGVDSAEESANSQQEDFLIAQVDLNNQLLAKVQSALQRISEGTYGECLVDGEEIAKARLDAVPWADYCVKHQSLIDQYSSPIPEGVGAVL